MKKILVLATLILLVAGGLFADVVVSGNIDYGVASDFDENVVVRQDAKIVVTGKLGDFTTAKTRLLVHNIAGGPAGGADTWVLTTDMAGALGLDGFKWTMATGREWYATANLLGIAAYNVGRGAVRLDSRQNWVSWNEMTFADMVNVKLGYAPAPSAVEALAGAMLGGVDFKVDPVSAAVALWLPNISDTDTGFLTVGARADIPMDGMALAVGAGYKMSLGEGPYNLGAALEFKMDDLATVNVGYWGVEDSILNRAAVRVRVPVNTITFDAGAVLNLDTEAEYNESYLGEDNMLAGLDIAAETKIGAATYRLGWMMRSEGVDDNVISGALDLPGIAGTGGVYFNAKVSY